MFHVHSIYDEIFCSSEYIRIIIYSKVMLCRGYGIRDNIILHGRLSVLCHSMDKLKLLPSRTNLHQHVRVTPAQASFSMDVYRSPNGGSIYSNNSDVMLSATTCTEWFSTADAQAAATVFWLTSATSWDDPLAGLQTQIIRGH